MHLLVKRPSHPCYREQTVYPKPAGLYRAVILGEWNQRHAGCAANLNKFRFMRRQNHTDVACKAREAWPTEESYKADAILHR